MSISDERFHLRHDGALLELSARREGLRTRIVLFRDGERVAERAGAGKVLLPLTGGGGDREGVGGAGTGPAVLALGVLPGTVHRALLLVPRPAPAADEESAEPAPPALDDVLTELPRSLRDVAGLAAAEKHRFAPPPGSPAARLLAFAREHPRAWASRHVVLAVVNVAVGVLGLSAFVRILLQPLVAWVLGVLRSVPWPDVDLPDIPWPDIPWPAIPWPDIDLPDLVAPGWLLFLVGTAKFWGPVLVAIGLGVLEVRRRRRSADRTEEDRGAHR